MAARHLVASVCRLVQHRLRLNAARCGAELDARCAAVGAAVQSTFHNTFFGPPPSMALAHPAADSDDVDGGDLESWDSPCADPIDWDGVLNAAVPKRRSSHHRKRQKMRHKWLKPRQNITVCLECGEHKLLHHLCLHCMRAAKVEKKRLARGEAPEAIEEE